MNIFVLDTDPKVAAAYHCDQHLPKMILEAAQMLCTVAAGYGIAVPYKPTHKAHPCTVWVGQSRGNARWVYQLSNWLEVERKRRGGPRTKNHASMLVLDAVWPILEKRLPDEPRTAFVQCMPEEFRGPDAVEAYRRYYHAKAEEWAAASRPMVWVNGEPGWMKGG